MKLIAVLDCNNFFVSCERLFRPDLKNKPVVVLSSNDGCVIARSQEIKDRGIPMAVPYFQVKDKLAEIKAIIFSAHLALYRDISRRVFAVVERSYDEVEEYSIDECFFYVDSEKVEEELKALKDRVEREVGVPVSLGVASSKTIAKQASKLAKKTSSGVEYISNNRWREQFSDLSLSQLWGVAGGRSQQFARNGLTTVADLIATDDTWLKANLGKETVNLKAEVSGQRAYPLQSSWQLPKSFLSSRSFAKTTNDINLILDAVSYHVGQVVKSLKRNDLNARTIKVGIYPSRFSDWQLAGTTLAATMNVPTASLLQFNKQAISLARSAFRSGVPYQRVAVSLSEIGQSQMGNATLFSEEKPEVDITATILRINQQFAQDVIQLGRLPKVFSFTTKQEAKSPAYTTRWTELQKVKA